jgi:hypothetical protein
MALAAIAAPGGGLPASYPAAPIRTRPASNIHAQKKNAGASSGVPDLH